MTDIDLTPLKAVMRAYAPQGRTALVPALHAAQEIYGYLPEPVAAEVARSLKVPLADVFGVIDFYAMFHREPVGKTEIHVCNDPACAMAGSENLMTQLNRQLEFHLVDENTRPSISIESSPCLGLCSHAPAMLVNGKPVGLADKYNWNEMASGGIPAPQTEIGGTMSLLTANCGLGYTTLLNEYRARGGYESLRKALTQTPGNVIEEIKAAGLVGRGGAAFPTGIKWDGTARAEGYPKYVVCNGDEAEPGTFKDRILMENDPHSVLEGLIIAAFAVGAVKGYIYIRGEYLQAYKAMQAAVEDANRENLLGTNILGSGFSFDVELRRGAGAYICGEETALFESIEGKRGFPESSRPSRPPTVYLANRPPLTMWRLWPTSPSSSV